MYKKNQIIKIKNIYDDVWVHYIIIEVTEKMYNNSRKLRWYDRKPGLYAMRGFWYGRDVHSYNSFGKILTLDHFKFIRGEIEIVHDDTFCLKNEYLKKLLG